MSSKLFSSESAILTVKTLVLELEPDSMSFVTLRVKQDRRQAPPSPPPALERRGRQGAYVKKPASN